MPAVMLVTNHDYTLLLLAISPNLTIPIAFSITATISSISSSKMIPRKGLLHFLCLLLSIHSEVTTAEFFKPFNVTYDHRALVIDGKRRMLISAGIHYPRATPEMWPDLIAKSKEGGADVIQTYVFWNGHEPVRGQYYFEGDMI
ncbi:hypothetical protein K1719_013950 [Acacia pycnantha]|nr:hypothetical protein K1719_013950 [Acacia pycnantha]